MLDHVHRFDLNRVDLVERIAVPRVTSGSNRDRDPNILLMTLSSKLKGIAPTGPLLRGTSDRPSRTLRLVRRPRCRPLMYNELDKATLRGRRHLADFGS